MFVAVRRGGGGPLPHLANGTGWKRSQAFGASALVPVGPGTCRATLGRGVGGSGAALTLSGLSGHTCDGVGVVRDPLFPKLCWS